VREGPTRRQPTTLLAIAGVLFALRIAAGIYDFNHPPRHVDLIRWKEPAEAEEKARASGKPILYYFSAEWCGPCGRMRKAVFSQKELAAEVESRYYPVEVVDRVQEEGRNTPPVEALLKKYGVDAFPTLIVVGPYGGEPIVQRGYPGQMQTGMFLHKSWRQVPAASAAGSGRPRWFQSAE
jgi:thiol:disulfide interchange protein